MTNIEQKALELVNEVAQDVRYEPDDFEEERRDVFKALCRAIEQHEAFRQEVSNEILEYSKWCQSVGLQFPLLLDRLIIPKPDPLEMAREEAEKRAVEVAATHEGPTDNEVRLMQDAAYFAVREFEKSIGKHGLEIREKGK